MPRRRNLVTCSGNVVSERRITGLGHKMFRITAKHFVAGGVHDGARVTEAAPIISYLVGWSLVKVRDYVRKKGWILEWIHETLD